MRHTSFPVALLTVMSLLGLPASAQEGNGRLQPKLAFSFVVMGDPQPEEPPLEQPEVFRTILREAYALSPDCMVIVGDVIRGFSEDSIQVVKMWEGFQHTVSQVDLPVMLAVGNHDVWNAMSQSEYARRFGTLYRSYDFGAVHFIMLDSYVLGEFNMIAGDQLEWLKRDLESNRDARHIFVGVHAPLWAYGKSSNWMKEVHPLLARYNVRAVFAGHWHIYQRSSIRDGIRYYVTGGAGGMQAAQNEQGGEFHHYLHVAVRDDEVRYAVLKPGCVLSDSVVTRESSTHVQTLCDDVIGDPRIEARTDAPMSDRISLSLRNPLGYTVKGSLRWNMLRPAFIIDPCEMEFSLLPGESKHATFRVHSTRPTSMHELRSAGVVLDCTVSEPESNEPTRIRKELIIVRSVAGGRSSALHKVDGDLSDWKNGWPIRVDTRDQVTLVPDRWSGPEQASGRFALCLHDSTLYFAGTVRDSDRIHASRKEEPYQADAVSLYLDLRDSLNFQKSMFMSDVFLIVFAPPSDRGEEAYWQAVYPYGRTLTGVHFASKLIDGGYTIEASIPLSQLTHLDRSRKEIGLDVCIDNLDRAGNRTRMLWNGIWANFMYANRYGRLRLD